MGKKAKALKLTTEELGEIQGLQQKLYALKVRLGDTVIEQKNTMAQIDQVQSGFKAKEVELIKEVTKPEDLENKEVLKKA